MFVINNQLFKNHMKKSIIFIVTLIFLAGCIGTPQKRAEKSVKKYLKETANGNSASIKSVSFGPLQTITLKEDSAYLQARDSLFYYKRELTKTSNQFRLAEIQNKAKDFASDVNNREKFFEERNYKIVHRVKNEKRGEFESTFYLNSHFEVVE